MYFLMALTLSTVAIIALGWAVEWINHPHTATPKAE